MQMELGLSSGIVAGSPLGGGLEVLVFHNYMHV